MCRIKKYFRSFYKAEGNRELKEPLAIVLSIITLIFSSYLFLYSLPAGLNVFEFQL